MRNSTSVKDRRFPGCAGRHNVHDGLSVRMAVCNAQDGISMGETGRVVRLDARFDQLVPQGARLEKVVEGLQWVEGPVWNSPEGFLLFSDVPANTICKWQPGRGIHPFLTSSGYSGTAPFTGKEPGSNGLLFDSAHRLVLCQHGDRRVVRLEEDGRITILADRYKGNRFNSPNDAVFRSNGDLYFTDPPFGLPQTFDDPTRELPFSGVYRLTPDGKVTLLIKDLYAPNGIGFSPSEDILYVSNADKKHPVWMAYPVQPDGNVGKGRVFFDAAEWTKSKPGLPDGIKVDQNGNIFAAGPGGIYVFGPDGRHLGSIETGVATGNCAWGDDGSVLYIAAGTAIYQIELTTRGMGFEEKTTADSQA